MAQPIRFYTYPSCTSCRKTKAWLREKGIQFEERHIYKHPPTMEELKFMLQMTTNGTDELLSKRSQKFKELGEEIDELSLNQLMDLILEEPRLLRRPIITSGENMIVGYNKEALESILS